MTLDEGRPTASSLKRPSRPTVAVRLPRSEESRGRLWAGGLRCSIPQPPSGPGALPVRAPSRKESNDERLTDLVPRDARRPGFVLRRRSVGQRSVLLRERHALHLVAPTRAGDGKWGTDALSLSHESGGVLVCRSDGTGRVPWEAVRLRSVRVPAGRSAEGAVRYRRSAAHRRASSIRGPA